MKLNKFKIKSSQSFKKMALVLISTLIITFISGENLTAKPNVVVIFTDDQGYNDIGCFGSALIRTPNLDQMAEEGMRFTDFYSANSVCSPSRASLLTGSYPPRAGVTKVLFPRDSVGLHPGEVTIADLLKDEGYATACIGKWHLGHHPKFLPTRQGFDYYFGIPYSNDMTIDAKNAQFAKDTNFREGFSVKKVRESKTTKNYVPLMRNEKVVEYPADQTTLTKRYTEEAIKFIKDNREKPFFLYLPHTMPHIPLFATPEFLGKSAEGLYGDTIEEIDWSVGKIMESIKSLGLDENTLVVFTSDNGPWKLKSGHGGNAFPLRGYKFSTYEGGMRVPCIMRWPGKIPAGSACSKVAATIDLLPTICEISGVDLPEGRIIDGRSILKLMRKGDKAQSPHEAYYYYKGTRLEAVRMGDWKLRITGNNKNKSFELFNLAIDISESVNLSKIHSDKVEQLAATMAKFDQSLKMARRPTGKLNE